jgi:hypothetical protein
MALFSDELFKRNAYLLDIRVYAPAVGQPETLRRAKITIIPLICYSRVQIAPNIFILKGWGQTKYL